MENIKNKKDIKSRLSNLELLRIISMIMIVSSHYVTHAPEFVNGLTINKYILDFINLGGKIGVNCFILITGYFLVKSKFKVEKLIKIIIEVFTYSVLIFVITIIFTDKQIGIKDLLKSFMPIIYSNYWFVTSYVGLYIFTPFLNKLIKTLSVKEYKNLLLISFITLSIIPTFTGSNFIYSNLIWFMFLYLLAGYIRLYYEPKYKNKYNILAFIFTYIIIFIFAELISVVAYYIPKLEDNTNYFAEINKLTCLICSVSIFMFFKNLNIKNNKYINIVASSTFAIYLMHDNYVFKEVFWEDVMKNELFYNSPFMMLHYIIVIILIFTVGTIVERLRQKCMDKPTEAIARMFKIKIKS